MDAAEWEKTFEALAVSVVAIRIAAKKSCGSSDLKRAAQGMGILVGGRIETPHGNATNEMVLDVAYFQPNERGVRPFDRFLAGPALTLPEPEQEVAHRMGRASFSIFRLAEKHETLGTWVEDILDNDRRIWLSDLDVDEPNPSHTAFAARVFDAGPFHMTLVTITSISDRMVNIFKRAQASGRLPYRRSLAETIYGLTQLKGLPPTHASGWKFVDDLGAEPRPGGT